MPRKRCKVFSFYTETVNNRTVIYRCKFCNAEYTKHATRMTSHLQKCLRCPQHVKRLFTQTKHTEGKFYYCLHANCGLLFIMLIICYVYFRNLIKLKINIMLRVYSNKRMYILAIDSMIYVHRRRHTKNNKYKSLFLTNTAYSIVDFNNHSLCKYLIRYLIYHK